MRVRARIILTIDPTATPSEVAAVYSRLRADEFGRVRRLDAKHAQLAVFVFRHQALTASEQWATWNSRVKKPWRYRFPSTFKREGALAVGALADLRPHRPG